MQRMKLAITMLAIVGLGLSAMAADITVGAKNFTEQYVVGNLIYILLEENGYDVELREGMATTIIREAMVSGEVDVAMSYTGNGWLLFPEGGNAYAGETQQEMYENARDHDVANGLTWLEPIWCNNTYAVAVTNAFAQENNVYSVSAFADYVDENDGDVPFCTTFEFYARPDGLLGVQLHYDFAFKPSAIKTVLAGLTFEPLINGEVEGTIVFGTDPIVAKENWVALQDDKNFWPPYDLAPVVRQEILDEYPEIEGLLSSLVAAFPSDPVEARAEMTALNAKVDVDFLEPEDVAREWLEAKGLI